MRWGNREVYVRDVEGHEGVHCGLGLVLVRWVAEEEDETGVAAVVDVVKVLNAGEYSRMGGVLRRKE